MDRILGRYSPYLYALLRIVAGGMYLVHSTQKLFSFPIPPPFQLRPIHFVAGGIEIVCGTLLIIGLFGSWAAFIASGEMAVAYLMFHAPRGFWPIQNQGELAALYCFLFLYIASCGSGVWSIDNARSPALERGPGPVLHKRIP